MKKIFRKELILAIVLVSACLSLWAGPAWAGPQGGTVTSGSAAIDQVTPGVTNITQFTDRVIINWERYGIGLQELVRYLQPGDLAVALNRVTGVDPSVILGSLQANGRIFILNPNGILFGPQSRVDVGGLMATTLSISDRDFLDGNYAFFQDPSKQLSFVVNKGQIQAADGGFVVLVAPLVNNEGTIIANLGHVVVGGSSRATVSFDTQGLINFAIPGTEVSGNVVMTTEACADVLRQVVNNGGIVDSGALIEQDGQVMLVRGEGLAVNSGTVQANGEPGRDAGSITINSTQATVLTPTSNLEARGIGENSNGGLIETSTHRNMVFGGGIDASAEQGRGGEWLLDPTTVTVTAAASDYVPPYPPSGGSPYDTNCWNAATNNILNTEISTTLQSGITITISTAGTQPGAGNIVVDAPIDGTGATPGGGLILQAVGGVDINAGISLNGGSFNSSGTFFDNTGGNIATGGGMINIAHTGNITLGANLNAGSNLINIGTNGGGINQTGGSITGINLAVTSANSVNLGQPGNDVSIVAGQVTGAGQTFLFRDANALEVGFVSPLNGIVTNNGTVTLNTINGSLSLYSTFPINAGNSMVNLTAGGPDAQLNVFGNVSGAGGIIYAADNMDLSTGSTNAGSNVVNLRPTTLNRPIDLGSEAAGSLSLTNAELNTISAGIVRVGDNNSGGILISTAINPQNFPTLFLGTNFGVTQSIETAITVPGLVIQANNGPVVLDMSNNVGTLAASIMGEGNSFTYMGANTLTVGSLSGVFGVTVFNADITIYSGNTMTLNDDLKAGTGGIFLTSAGGGIVQTGGSIIADRMLLTGLGSFNLNRPGNDLGVIAASIDGPLAYTDANGFVVGTVGAAYGINTNNNNINLTAGGIINIGQDIFAGTASVSMSTAAGGVNQTGGVLIAGSLDLAGTGVFNLNQPGNNTGTMAANVTGNLSFTDVDDITIGTVTSSGIQTHGGGLTLNCTGISQLASSPVNTGGGPYTANAGSGIYTAYSSINTVGAGGGILITASGIDFMGGAGSVSGSANISLLPSADAMSVGIGDGAGGTFLLENTDIAAMADGFASIVIGRPTGQHPIMVNPVTFYDPVVIRTPGGGSIAVMGTITGSGNSSVHLEAPSVNTTLNANIVTAGCPITIDSDVLIGIASIMLDTTNGGGMPAGAAINITGTTNSLAGNLYSLDLNAGSAGIITLNGAVGNTSQLNVLTVMNSNGTSFNGTFVVDTAVLSNTTAGRDIKFNDATSIQTLTVAPGGYIVTFLGATTDVTDPVVFQNTGSVVFGNGGDVLNFAGVTHTAGMNDINGNITVTGGAINLNNTTNVHGSSVLQAGSAGIILGNTILADGVALTLNASMSGGITVGSLSGTPGGVPSDISFNAVGPVNVNGPVGVDVGTLTVTYSGGTTFAGAVGSAGDRIGTVALSNTGGTIQFNGNLYAMNLTDPVIGYSVAMLGAVTDIVNPVNFMTTGTVTFGDGGDSLTFAGGVTHTAGPNIVNGNITTVDSTLNLNNTTSVLGSSTLAAGSGLITLGATNLSDSVILTLGTGGSGGVDVYSLAGSPSITPSDVTFNVTGPVNVSGSIGTDIGTLTVTNSGGTVFAGAVGSAGDPIGTVNLVNWAGTIQFSDDLYAVTLTTGASVYHLAFLGGTTSVTNAVNFQNTGIIAFGTSGSNLMFPGGVIHTAGVNNIGANITTVNNPINMNTTTNVGGSVVLDAGSGLITLGDTTLADGAILTLGTGGSGGVTVGSLAGTPSITPSDVTFNVTGPVSVTGTIGTDIGTLTVMNSGGTVFGGAVGSSSDRIGTVVLTNTGGTIQFNGNLYATTLTDPALGYNVAMLGAVTDIVNPVIFYTTGTVTLGNGGDNLTFTGGVTHTDGPTNIAGTVNTTNTNINFAAVTLTGNTVLNTGTGAGDINLNSTVDGGYSLNLTAGTGNIVFTGAVGTTNRIGALTINSATDVTASTIYAASISQVAGTGMTTFNGALDAYGTAGISLIGNIFNINNTVSTGLTGPVTITNAGILTIAETGDMYVDQAFLQNGAGPVLTAGDIILGGPNKNISFMSSVTLTGNILLNAGVSTSNILFNSTLDGPYSITLLAVNTAFNGTIGSVTPLTDITTDAYGGTTALNGGAITTTGAQTYNDAVTLGANTTLTGEGITFASTVNGAHTLNINDSGTTTFGGVVGGITPLYRITTDASGSTVISGGSITTEEYQVYNDPVILGADTTISASVLTFASTINGAYNLTINNMSPTTFGGAVGSTTALAGLTTDSSGTTEINGGLIHTSGAQTYNDAVLLGNNTVLASTNNSDISLNNIVNGAYSLTVNTGGTTIFSGDVGDLTPLINITTDAAGTTAFGIEHITTTGTQTYNDAVTLYTNAIITGAGITFGSTVDGVYGAYRSLVVNDSGTTTFCGIVGGVYVLGGITTDAAGETLIYTTSINTSDAQIFNDPVKIMYDTTFTGSGITFASTLDSYISMAMLTVIDSGTTTFGGVVGGGATPLAGIVTGAGGVTAMNGGAVTTNNNQTYNDAVILGANTVSTAFSGGITFGGTLDGGFNLDLTVASGCDVIFSGAVGGTTRLGALTINSAYNVTANAITAASITQSAGTGTTTFNGALNTNAAAGIALTGNAFNLNSAVNTTGGGPLTIYNLGLLTIAAAGDMNLTGDFLQNGSGPVSTAGDITAGSIIHFTTGVTLTGDVTLGNSFTQFNSTLDGTYNLLLLSAASNFQGAVGGVTPLNSLTTGSGTGDTNVSGGLITTTGTQTYNGAFVIGVDTTLNGVGITFASTIGGHNRALVINDSGTTIISGYCDDFASITTDAAGTTAFNGSVVISSYGNQTYNDPVTLGDNAALISTNAGNVELANIINGPHILTVNTAGTTIFGGIVGGVTPLTSLGTDIGGTTAINGGAITTTGAQTYDDAVTLGNDTTLTGVNITFASTITNAVARTLTVNDSGTTTFGGTVGVGPPNLISVTTDTPGMTAINGGSIITSGVQIYNDAVTLGANALLIGAGIIFNTTLNGARTLTISDSGTTSFVGIVGGVSPLISINTAAGGATAINTTAITTTGAQTYNDVVTLGANVLFTGVNITFGTTIMNTVSRILTVNDSGITTFGGTVGNGPAVLISVITDAPGLTAINGGAIMTSSSQTFNDEVILGANTTLDGAGITFASTLDGAHTLTISCPSAPMTFGGVVGGVTPLTSISITTSAGGSTAINGGAITTTGAQIYNDAVTLGANTTLTGEGITFASTVNGAHTLTLIDSSTTTFGGVVGGITPLAGITTSSGGTTVINGGAMTTTGGQTYYDAVVLGAGTNINGYGIGFDSTLDGPHDLAINNGGTTSFNGIVGGDNPLASINTDSAGATAIYCGSITTTGDQTYNDPVTLWNNVTLTSTASGNVRLAGNLNRAQTLTVNTAGSTIFGGLVGGVTPLVSITTDAAGFTEINGGLITTSGPQIYNDPVTLGADAALTGNGITFASTLNGSRNLTINDGTAVTFIGAVGGVSPLTSLTTAATGMTVINGGSVITIGAQAYNDAVILGSDTVLSSVGAGNISLLGTVNGAWALTVNTPGITTFGGMAGGATPLSSITTDAAGSTAINGASMTTAGAQVFNDAVVMGANAVLAGSGLTFGSTLDGNYNLDLAAGTGDITFSGPVGGAARLAALTISGAHEVFSETISVAVINQSAGSGTTTFNGPLDTNGPGGITLTGNSFIINSVVTTTGGGPVTVTNSGLLTIGAAGHMTLGGSFLQNGAGQITTGGNITTANGNIVFTSYTTLSAPVVFNAGMGTVSLGGVTCGPHDLNLTADEMDFTGGTGSISGSGYVNLAPSADTVSIGIAGGAGILQLTTTDIAALADGFSRINIGSATGLHDITVNAVTFNDPVAIRTPNGGSITVNGRITGSGNASIFLDGLGYTTTLNSDVVTSGNPITINDHVLIGTPSVVTISTAEGFPAGADIAINGTLDDTGTPSTLVLNSGSSGIITMGGAVGGIMPLEGLTVAGSNGITFGYALAVNALSLAGAVPGSDIVFNGPVTIGTLATSEQGYNVLFNAGGSVATDTDFLNTGTVSFGDDSGDIMTFTGGLNTIACAGTGISGALRTAGQQMDLGAVTLLSSSTIDTSNNGLSPLGASININSIAGNGCNLALLSRNGNTTVYGDATNIGTLALHDNNAASTGYMIFNNDLSAGTLTTAAQPYDVQLNGFNTDILNAADFHNTGTLVLGDNVECTLVFTGGLNTSNGPGGTNIAGFVQTPGTDMVFGPLTIAGNSILQSSNGNITFMVGLDGGYDLRLSSGSGNIVFTGAVGYGERLGALEINSAANVTAGAVNAASILQVSGTGTTSFNGPLNTNGSAGIALTGNNFHFNDMVTTTSGGPLTIANAGLLTVGVGGDMTLDGAFLQNGAGPVNTAGNITTTNDDITFGTGVTLTGNAAFNSGSGVGNIMFLNSLDGGFSLDLSAGAGSINFTGAVGAGTRLGGITINSTTNMTAGSMTASSINQLSGMGISTFGSLDTNGAAGISLAGEAFNMTGPVNTANGGPVTIINSGNLLISPSADMTLDGAFNQSGPGAVSIAGDITTTSDITFGNSVTLTGNVLLNTEAGNRNITFLGSIDGGYNLNLAAGSGNILFSGGVGGEMRLGALVVNSVNDLTANAITASSINQLSGAGTTIFNGPLDTDTAGGITLTGNAFNINNTVMTTAGGPVTINNAGPLPIAAAADMTLDGAFLQNGTGPVNIAGDITTTNDNITFSSANALSGPVVFNAGTGTVALQGLTCGPHDLNVIADGVDFNGGAGSIIGAGYINLMPSSDTVSIGIAGGTGTLQITTSDIAALADGFNRIIIGSASGQHAITINAVTFHDPVIIRTPNGGAITVDGQITGSGNASVFLDGLGFTTTLNADIVTEGNPIIINDHVLLGNLEVVTLNTADGVPAGANIFITGTVDDDGTASALVLNAGTGGEINLGGVVGGTTPILSLTTTGTVSNILCVTTSGAQTYNGAVNLNGDLSSNDSGAITFAGPVQLLGDWQIFTSGESGADIHFMNTLNGANSLYIDAGFGDIIMDGAVGGTVPLVDFGIGSAYNVSLPAISISGELSQGSGIGPTTFNGPVVSGGEVYMNCGSVVFAGTSSIVAGGGSGIVGLNAMFGPIQGGSSTADIRAGQLSLYSESGIGVADNPLATVVQDMDAECEGSGGIYIYNSGNLNLRDLGGASQAIYSNGGAVEISVASMITVCDPVNTDGGNVTFTAADGIIQSGNGSIDTTAATGTPCGNFMADAGMGSYIMNSGTFILSGYSELCGNIRIEAGEIGITRVDAGSSGSVELTAANGSILAGRVTGVNITGGDLMITAFDGIGNSLNPVLTKVENLTGLAESGSFFISEYRDLNLVDVRAGVDISITCAAGNMVVTYVSAGRDVYLTSLDGSINGEISKIYGQNVFLTMSGGILTEVVSPEPIITVRESLPAPVIDNETYLRAVGAVNELWMSNLSSLTQWLPVNALIIRTEQVLFVTPKANSIFVVEGEE